MQISNLICFNRKMRFIDGKTYFLTKPRVISRLFITLQVVAFCDGISCILKHASSKCGTKSRIINKDKDIRQNNVLCVFELNTTNILICI
jgi:hypothetical protein